ncbi:MAG TPA: threonine/serine exporter family protein [Ktedonobacterales bacterium]
MPTRDPSASSSRHLALQADIRAVLSVAMRAGELLCRAGAESAVVEESVEGIARAYGVRGCWCSATVTHIITTVDDPDIPLPFTVVRGVRSRTMDFQRLVAVDTVIARIKEGSIPLAEAATEMKLAAGAKRPFGVAMRILIMLVVTASTALLLGGSPLDAAVSAGGTLITLLLTETLTSRGILAMVRAFVGGLVTAALTITLVALRLPVQELLAIAGSIMILLPGALMVTSTREGIAGDLQSSTARGLEALLTGAVIASGLGLAIIVGQQLGVGLSVTPLASPLVNLPVQVASAGVAVVFFALSNYAPPRVFMAAGAVGALSWLIYLIMRGPFHSPDLMATFVAALIVGLIGWMLARWQRVPLVTHVIPSAYPLLPGILLVRAMLALVQGQNSDGLGLFAQTLFISLMIALGVALGNLAASVLARASDPAVRRLRALPLPLFGARSG